MQWYWTANQCVKGGWAHPAMAMFLLCRRSGWLEACRSVCVNDTEGEPPITSGGDTPFDRRPLQRLTGNSGVLISGRITKTVRVVAAPPFS